MLVEKKMKSQNKRNPLGKIRFLYYVSVPKANIRSGPGTNHEIIWQVYKSLVW